jgi:hypothetical protein
MQDNGGYKMNENDLARAWLQTKRSVVRFNMSQERKLHYNDKEGRMKIAADAERYTATTSPKLMALAGKEQGNERTRFSTC